MIPVSGYSPIEMIHKNSRITIWKGIRISDNVPVIIKFLQSEYPPEDLIAQFTAEYDIIKSCDDPYIIKVLDFKKTGNSYAIIMEDCCSISLNRLMKLRTFTFEEKMNYAVLLADAVMHVHNTGIIHKNVCVSNVIVNPDNNVLKIIDFRFATRFVAEKYTEKSINEWAISHCSPEQTGKINRRVDCRSDLYSLGVMLYLLFTGRMPYTDDDQNVLYKKIEESPQKPALVDPAIPFTLSEIIMKLLSIEPDDRYYNAAIVKSDLEQHKEHFSSGIQSDTFEIGSNDYSTDLVITQKINCREKEIGLLTDVFLDVQHGKSKCVVMTGKPGVGKSAVVKEFYRRVTKFKTILLCSRCRNPEFMYPYSALIDALDELLLILNNDKNAEKIKRKIAEAIGANGKVLVNLLPSLRLIMGDTPELPVLNPAIEKSRLLMAFGNLIRVFAREQYHLIFFIEDFQWFDSATFDIVKHLMSMPDIGNLMFIFSCVEIDSSDGTKNDTVKMLAEIEHKIMHIEPVNESVVNQLIAGTLHCSVNHTVMLSRYVNRIANGNLLYVKMLLRKLYQNGLLRYDTTCNQWNWIIDAVKDIYGYESIHEFIIEEIRTLSENSLDIITCASCLGTTFKLEDLYLLCGKPETIAESLMSLVERQIIIPVDNKGCWMAKTKSECLESHITIRFQFTHCQIRQAAYFLLDEKQKTEIHYAISKMLKNLFLKKNEGVILYDLVNNMSCAKKRITNSSECNELIDLNIAAGKKAISYSSYDIGQLYYKKAEMVFSENEWVQFPSKLNQLVYNIAEADCLRGNYGEALNRIDDLHDTLSDNYGKTKATVLRIKILQLKGESCEFIINEAVKGLREIGYNLPVEKNVIDNYVNEYVENFLQSTDKSRIQEISTLSELSDEKKLLIFEILFESLLAANKYYPHLFDYIQLRMFTDTLTYGIWPMSCVNIMACAEILQSLPENIPAAYNLSKTAFQIIRKYNLIVFEPECLFRFATYISHWKIHYSEGIQYYDMAIKAGMENGDLTQVHQAVAHKNLRNFYIGKPLDRCLAEIDTRNQNVNDSVHSEKNVLLNITRNAIQQLRLPCNADQEKLLLRNVTDTGDRSSICIFGQCNVFVHFILGNLEDATKWNIFTDDYLEYGKGFFSMPDHYMFKSLLLIKNYEKVPQQEKSAIFENLKMYLHILKIWAENCPANFSHKYYLIIAEVARIQNESVEKIMQLYNMALNSIRHDDFIHMKALIYETIGEFWIGRYEEFIGKSYIKEASYLYTVWGATEKVRTIEKMYVRMLSSSNHEIDAYLSHKNSSATSVSAALDIGSVLKTTQAISSEIKIDRLLKVMMYSLIGNTGAQFGCLLLQQDYDDSRFVEIQKTENDDDIQIVKAVSIDESDNFCREIVRYTMETRKNVILDNAQDSVQYRNNEYIRKKKVLSVLCMPIIYKGDLRGIIYLENNLMDKVFTNDRLEMLKLMSSQIAISIENAQLYEKLEEKVKERTIQLEIANNELKELSLHDPLTGLHNRRYVYEYLNDLTNSFIHTKMAILSNWQKRDINIENNVFGVFLIDIDHFKKVNDEYGHIAGDHVLLKMADTLKRLIRDDDYLVRWGGEEFIIILNKTKPEYLKSFSKKVLDQVGKTPVELVNKQIIYKTCSIGCVCLPFVASQPDALTLEETINLSDLAMYIAKENGRNRAVHINLQNTEKCTNDQLKEYVKNLARGSKVDKKYVNVEEIFGVEEELVVVYNKV
jgi:diguanylate cyclase (GGDEF)-like protein